MRSNRKMKTFLLLTLFCSSVFCANDVNNNDSLVYVRGKDIFRLFLSDWKYKTVLLKTANEDVKSLTVDSQRGLIYWNEGMEIRRANIDKMNSDTQFLDETITNNMAFDWMYNHIYYANNRSRQSGSIEVTDGKTVIALYINILIKDLALDPNYGYLFWVEVTPKGSSRIVKSASDGSSKSHEALVENLSESKYGRYGITLDTSEERVYWCEQNRFFYVDYFGKGKTDIGVGLGSPAWSIVIQGDWIYWSRSDGLSKADKMKGHGNLKIGQSGNSNVNFTEMQLYSMFKSDVPIKCHDFHSCLCLPAPRQTSGRQFTCRCDKSSNNITCDIQTKVEDKPYSEKFSKDASAMMLFATGGDISKVLFKEQQKDDKVSQVLNSLADTKVFDIAFKTNLLFCFDVKQSKIYKSQINKDDKETLIVDNTITMSGLAVDWIYDNIYWTDKKKNTIEIVNLNKIRTILVKKDLNHPAAIVVDPKKALMFWAEPDRLGKANMNGSAVTTFVSDVKITGLTLDVEYERVYWFDAKRERYAWSRYDGEKSGSWKLKEVPLRIQPYSIAVSGEWVYWSDVGGSYIRISSKFTGETMKTLVTINSAKKIYDIKIYHPSKQPMGQNYCSKYCSHFCLPATETTARCFCPLTYSMMENEATCLKGEIKRSDAYLLLAREHDIYKINLGDFARSITVYGGHFITSLDLHFSKKTLYWYDLTDKTIYSALFEPPYKKTPILKDNSLSIHSLAIDWVYSHIYWTNWVNGSIEVANMNCSFRKVLLQDEMHTKWGIAVNPLEHWMFWSNGKDNKIEKAGLDGSNRKVILSTDVQEPTDLAIELKEKRVYWTNTQLREIHSCDFNGKHVENILVGLEFRPYSLVIFEGSIYWTTRGEIAVFTANKSGEWKVTPVTPSHFSGKRPASLKVFHKSKQPDGMNYCQVLSKHCSHLCLPVPEKKDIVNCDCPDGFRMKADGITCKMNVHRPDCKRRYIIEVWILNNKSKNNKKYCSGTIISERWVLTAATCVINSGGARYVKVNPNIGSKAFEKFWDIIGGIFHPKIKSSKDGIRTHDVVLLKISKRITGRGRIHQFDFNKWDNSPTFSKKILTTSITYCEDKEQPDVLNSICATTEDIPGEITPLHCKGGPVLEDGNQIGLLSYADLIDTNRFVKFNVEEYKDFFLNYTINKHRRYIISRPFWKSPQKSHLVTFKVQNKPAI